MTMGFELTDKNNNSVTVFEVGPRDGLQSLELEVPTATKIDLIDALSNTGLKKIEVTSFVSPKWVPQLADANEVMLGISRNSNVCYTSLTPNFRGFQQAMLRNSDEIAIFAAASEGFSRANLNCSIEQSLERFKPILEVAHEKMIPVRAYVSCVIACPFDGIVSPRQVLEVVQKLRDMGCYEVSLGDTIGAGDRASISLLLDDLLSEVDPQYLAGHFHDTNNTALEMIEECANRGLRVFDSSISGMGGCPYAPGATGNVDTRKVLNLLENMGFETGINYDALGLAEEISSKIISQRVQI